MPIGDRTLERYQRYLREVIKSSSTFIRFGDRSSYGALIRLQHLRALQTIFAPLRGWMSSADLDRLFDAFRKDCPPNESHPSRWARPFATWLAERAGVSPRLVELADYTALRLEVAQLPVPGPTTGELRSYRFDPRERRAVELSQEQPVILLLQRDGCGRLYDFVLSPDMVAAFGVESFAITEEDCLLRISPERLSHGAAELRRARQNAGFVDDKPSCHENSHYLL